jgi:hypothetical protein
MELNPNIFMLVGDPREVEIPREVEVARCCGSCAATIALKGTLELQGYINQSFSNHHPFTNLSTN